MGDFRRQHRELSAQERELQDDMKVAAENLDELFVQAQLMKRKDDATAQRAISIAKTKLEEALMWAVKGVTAP